MRGGALGREQRGNITKSHDVRDGMTLIYLLLFAAPQLLLYLYLRERLPPTARRPLAVVFVVFNIPWVIVAVRMFSGSLWGISRTPYIAPWIAWQLLGWIFAAWWRRTYWEGGLAVRRLGGSQTAQHANRRTAEPPDRPVPSPIPRPRDLRLRRRRPRACPPTASGARSGCP